MVTGHDVDPVGGDEETQREEQRVARQEREEQPALDEDDQHADPDERRAELVQQLLGVQPLDAEQHRLPQQDRVHTPTVPAGT